MKMNNLPMCTPCVGGYNNYRTREIAEGIAKHVEIGHWLDFDIAIKWIAYEDIEEKRSNKNLRATMTTRAEELLRALDTIDKNELPNNNILRKG